jgi:hypothetical protein
MKPQFLDPEFRAGLSVDAPDAKPFVFGRQIDYRRLTELHRDNRDAFDRMTYLMFHVVWREPPISSLQTKLWTC